MSYYYFLASPYTHDSERVRTTRYLEALEALGWCFHNKIWVYSPIVHTHSLAVRHNLPVPFEFWMEHNHTMIRASQGVLVLKINGWRESRGIADEVSYAQRLDKTVRGMAKIGDMDYRIGWSDKIVGPMENSL